MVTDSLKFSKRSDISPFIVMDVMQAAAEREATGRDVLHMEVGQPSTSAPRTAIEAAQRALAGDKLGYTVALGLPALRERIARHYRDFYRLDVPAERIIVTTGSSGGFLLACLATFDTGDRVAMAAPGYPCYRNILAALGVDLVDIPTGPETRYQPTPELLERLAGDAVGLIVAGPANPTGTMIDDQAMARLSRYCRERSLWLLSDEIYHGISFTSPSASAAAHHPDAIVLNSFSKYFSMTGWRLGWMVVPPALVRRIERLEQNLFISAPTLSQLGGIAAFDAYDELNGHVARYARNRELLLNELPRAGLDKFAPADGAFYIYCDISHLTDDSEAFCRRLLADTGIAATPGVDFDPARGGGTMRLSFAGSTEDMAEAARRLRSYLGRRRSHGSQVA